VVVGGGAGTEPPRARGDKLGKRNKARVTLTSARARISEAAPTKHAGSMDIGVYETNHLAQSHWHYFRYRVGEMIGLDRERRMVTVAPFVDDDGDQVTPEREFSYDTLVMAVGSLTNDFGTPGAKEYAISLETAGQAERFHRRLVNAYIRAQRSRAAASGAAAGRDHRRRRDRSGTRGGAARRRARRVHQPGPHRSERTQVDSDRGRRPDSARAPPRLSDAATKLLAKLSANVRTSARGGGLARRRGLARRGHYGGVGRLGCHEGARVSKDLGGLESNRINQLVVLPTLNDARREYFRHRDCAACPWLGKEGAQVPPRAQSAHPAGVAHGEADRSKLRRRPLHRGAIATGSLVSLGEYSVVGNHGWQRRAILDRGVAPNDVSSLQDA
jgi:NADH dehydrogenase